MSAEEFFVRVVPEEIERYGFAGAVFVAHIRYRCATDGPGRDVIDGLRWWRVPLAELAAELHVSKDVAQRTMKRLGDAVAAKRSGRPGDQTRAYYVPPYVTGQNAESHRLDLPERDSAPVPGGRREIAPVPTRFRTGTDAESRSVPLSGEVEEGGEGDRVDVSTTTATPTANSQPATPDPFDYRDDPPEDQPGPFGEAAAATASPPRIAALPLPLTHWPKDYPEPEPPERCPTHADWDTNTQGRIPNCGRCADARTTHEAWEAARARWRAERAEATRTWRDACDDCDDEHGHLLGTDRTPVDPAVWCPHAVVWWRWWRHHIARPRDLANRREAAS
ncbi:hypothetical protein ABQF26_04395 [Mycolicibacterium elephantis]